MDKSVLIFGPGKHFGLHIAKRFAAEGFYVIAVARSESGLQEFSEALQHEDRACTAVVGDVTKPEELKSLCADALMTLPPLHTVIFNVKTSLSGNGLKISPEELTSALASNVSGALAAIQACVPHMQSGGSIILTGGGYKDKPDPEKIILSVSKGALHTLYLSMMEPLKTLGIHLSTIVIDGVVREEGPITSHDVAELFWNVSQDSPPEPVYIS